MTLFASGDSITAAQAGAAACPRALRLDPSVRDPIPYYMLMLDKVRQRAEEFDILHFHIDQFHFPLFRPMADRTVTTLHGRQDLPDLHAALSRLSRHAAGLDLERPARADPGRQLRGTVYHGLPRDLHRADLRLAAAAIWPSSAASRRKSGPTAPSRSRERCGMPLKIAAKVDRADEAYFRDGDRAAAASSRASSSSARSTSTPEAEFLGEAQRAAVPDRLAGAVRPGDDRGDGLRHAGAGLPLRLGAGGDRRRRDRLYRRHGWRRRSRSCRRSWRSTGARAPALRGTILRHAHGEGLRRVYRSLIRRPLPISDAIPGVGVVRLPAEGRVN